MQTGEGPQFLPQGQTLGLFHHLVVFVLRLSAVNGPVPLRHWFDVFAFSTNVFIALILGIALWLVRRRERLIWPAIASLLFIIFADRSGIFFAIDPDYLGLELAAIFLVAGLAARWKESKPLRRCWAMAGLGMLAGAMAGVKFPLGAATLLVATPLWFSPEIGSRQRVAEALLFCSVAVVTLFTVLLSYYLGDAAMVVKHFHLLAEFIQLAGPETKFWPSLFTPSSPAANPGADYGYARIVVLGWIGVVFAAIQAYRGSRNRRLLVVATTAVTLAGCHLWGLATRPAGTTLWEVSLFLLVSSICVLSELPEGLFSRRVYTAVVLILVGSTAVLGPPRLAQMLPLSRLQVVSESIWDSHRELTESRPSPIFLFLDGNHAANTVGEAIMKACVDFPEGRLGKGRAALATLGGNMQICTAIGQVPLESSVLLVEIPGEKFPELEASRSVKRWDVTVYPWWPRSIALYLKPTSSGH